MMMNPEEIILDQKRAALGDLIVEQMSLDIDMRHAYDAGDQFKMSQIWILKEELERKVRAAEVEVYQAKVASLEAHRANMLRIVEQQMEAQAINNPTLLQAAYNLKAGIAAGIDKEIDAAKEGLASSIERLNSLNHP